MIALALYCCGQWPNYMDKYVRLEPVLCNSLLIQPSGWAQTVAGIRFTARACVLQSDTSSVSPSSSHRIAWIRFTTRACVLQSERHVNNTIRHVPWYKYGKPAVPKILQLTGIGFKHVGLDDIAAGLTAQQSQCQLVIMKNEIS